MPFTVKDVVDAAIVQVTAVQTQAVTDVQAALASDAQEKAAQLAVLNAQVVQIAQLQARIAELEADNPPDPPPPPPPPPPVGTTWPKLATTGPRAGVVFTNYSGPVDVVVAGTVIEKKTIRGQLNIKAANCVIRDCKFQNFSNWGLLTENANGLKVEYCEFDGTGSTKTSGIGLGNGSNLQVTGCDFHHMTLAMQIGSGAIIKGNYVHDLFDTSNNPDDRHFDGITVFRGSNIVIENNAIIMPTPDGGTAAVFISAKFSSLSNIKVHNNLLMGNASYTLYSETYQNNTVSGVVITNNYIDRGLFGYVTFSGNDPVYTGNVQWRDGIDPTPAAVQTWKNAT